MYEKTKERTKSWGRETEGRGHQILRYKGSIEYHTDRKKAVTVSPTWKSEGEILRKRECGGGNQEKTRLVKVNSVVSA